MSEKKEFSIKIVDGDKESVLVGETYVVVVADANGQTVDMHSINGIGTLELISACVACGVEQLLENGFPMHEAIAHIAKTTSIGIKTAIESQKGGNAVEQIAADAH